MKKQSIPLYIGVICSLIAIWFVNGFLLVEPCVENGGSFEYSKAQCLLANGENSAPVIAKYIMAIYFFMGILISLFVSFSIRKIFKIKQ